MLVVFVLMVMLGFVMLTDLGGCCVVLWVLLVDTLWVGCWFGSLLCLL